MAKYRVEDIRNVAFVGHEVAGKTSLVDSLLFKAKAVDRKGSIDDGTSFSDFDEEEKKLKYSIDTSLLHLEHGGKQVHILDGPGKPDFVGSALGGRGFLYERFYLTSASRNKQMLHTRFFDRTRSQALLKDMLSRGRRAD